MPPPEIIRFAQPLRDVQARARGATPFAAEGEAYERGRRDGEKALNEQLLRQRTEWLALQNGVLTALRQSIPKVVRDCEAALVELALEVARRLVAGLPVSSEMVEAAVREALAQAHETTELLVQLHPEDFALLQRANSPLLVGADLEKMRFQTSPEVTRGGCLVQTRFGVIDARRENKLELLQQSLAS